MKKIISIILILAIVMTFPISISAAEKEADVKAKSAVLMDWFFRRKSLCFYFGLVI